VAEDAFVDAAQLYAAHALVLDDEGRDLGEAAWHESDLVQRLPDGRGLYVVDARALRARVRERTVADLIDAARAAGGDVRPAEALPFELPVSPRLTEPPFTAVRVYAGVTHTIGGLRIDEHARVLDDAGNPVPGLHAAGADAGGIFTGGYGSGLAAALVFGRIAAETALA
jgi:predicted oxidoreductase